MEQNIPEEVFFKNTCRQSLKVLAAVWSSYSVKGPLAPASEKGTPQWTFFQEF